MCGPQPCGKDYACPAGTMTPILCKAPWHSVSSNQECVWTSMFKEVLIGAAAGKPSFTQWGQIKMADTLQVTIINVFSWIKHLCFE